MFFAMLGSLRFTGSAVMELASALLLSTVSTVTYLCLMALAFRYDAPFISFLGLRFGYLPSFPSSPF